jgi:hypothetical protein
VFLVAGAAALTSALSFGSSDRAAPTNVMVVYVGAEDCAPCRVWRRNRFPAFVKSPEYHQVAYREVVSPTVLDLLSDEHWPDDLRRFRASLDQSAGVPLWFIVADGAVRLTARGLREWDSLAVPKIRSFLR